MKELPIHCKTLVAVLRTACLLVLVGTSLAGSAERSLTERDQERISPVLLDQVSFSRANPAQDREFPVIVRVSKQYFDEDLGTRRQMGRSQRNMLKGIHSYAGRLTARQIEALLASDQVEYVTLDATIRLSGKPLRTARIDDPSTTPAEPVSTTPVTDNHVRITIGADQIAVSGKPPTGKNVCVAVFDSGMTHPDITWDGNGIWNGVDFTSGSTSLTGSNLDEYGHGTAVSGLIGGDGAASAGGVLGIAPDVYFMDMKVVGPDGTGLTSQLIQAIDWVIDHRAGFNIRVANLSLGHPPVDSYQNDPLCQAVERMVKAGIVTVVSAGNLGKTAAYPEIWGGITSPGNDPLVITVGAMNTHGTVTHADDTAASYSSRGPSYPDGLFKPDLVAPGNRLLCPSVNRGYLATHYPDLTEGGQYIRLSGSSMATAVVSGTAALMLDANPNLNPNLVKLILLSTAIKMPQPSMLEQGNGMVNAKTAVELAKAVDVRNQIVADSVSPQWTLSGEYGPESVWAGGAFAYGDQIVYGELVQADLAGFWGNGVFWTDFLSQPQGVFWADSLFRSNGVFWTDGVFWADALAWTQGVFWTDVPCTFDGVFWTDFFASRGVFWTEALVAGDGTETDIATVSGD